MSHDICLDRNTFLKKTCRTCGRYDPNDFMKFHQIFNAIVLDEPSAELAPIFKEFQIWNLEVTPFDGLPQQICGDCLERFVQVKLFREEVMDSQQFLRTYLKDGDDPIDNSAKLTFETLSMSVGTDACVGYISPSKLIEYVGSEEENESATVLGKTDTFEANESDYLFNNPNRIDVENVIELSTKVSEIREFKGPSKQFEKVSETEISEKEEALEIPNIGAKCEICLKTFRSADHLMRHHRLFHIRQDRTCSVCSSKFEKITQRSFDYHVKTHLTKKYKCSYCEKGFHQKIHMINHERTHTKEKPFACEFCGKSFRQQVGLQEHLMKHKNSQPFKCEICGKGFAHRSGVRSHLRLHANDKRFQCDICGTGFYQKIHLTLHLMKHKGEKPFQCEFCPKAFRQAYQLGNHMHSVHFNTLDSIQNGCFHCPECGRESTNIIDYIRHKKSHDNMEQKFICQQCGAAFVRENHLSIHIDTVHLKPTTYTCTFCKKTFNHAANLNSHLETHQDAEKYKCTFCDKWFTAKGALQMHEAIHTGKKNFKCNFCSQSFVYRRSLGAHIMNHFRDENEEELTINEDNMDEDDFFCYGSDLDIGDELGLDMYPLELDEG